ncbi:MAG: hypothetical protein KJ687_05730 [Proteobacteria bacterium]|nr:hypothetical protein [Pseudomonadota bacterium]
MIVLLVSTASLALTTAIQEQTRPQAKSPVKPTKQNDAIAAFLSVPIDLITFKIKKGPSNSGSFKASHWIYRPKEPGFFYQYKLFVTPTRYSEGERFRGFSIVVYRFGKEIGDYYDSKEKLLAIWCRLRDPDLGQADLVGRFLPEIKARFGEPFAVVGDILIYHRHGRALSVHTKDGTVDWFKYVRLSRDIDAPGAVPELLLQPGPGW